MEAEYEVETVLRAKVFMKGKKMGWKFYVKWKGYEDTENTWEPFRSFENCGEGVIERFWERVDTKGRDVDSIEGWTNGEEVYPVGPPRRRSRTTPKKDITAATQSPTDGRPSSRRTTNGTKAKRPLESPESQSPSKRTRASSSRRKSDTKVTRRSQRQSRTPVPDSQSEDELLMTALPKTAADPMVVDTDASKLADQVELENGVKSSSQGQSEGSEQEQHDRPSRVSNHVQSQPPMPTMVDDIDSSAASGSHPGADPQEFVCPHPQRTKDVSKGLKGRNASLLTFSKKTGGLETLKRGRAGKENEADGDAEEVVEHLESTSTALASMAVRSGSSSFGIPPQGRDSTTEAEQTKVTSHDDTQRHLLQDYEEQNQPSPSSPKIELPDKMPTSISFPEPPSGGTSPWKRATIFGPLSIACSPSWATPLTSDNGLSSSIPKPFLLNLDNSISVPVALKDVSSARAIHRLHLESIESGTVDPPGKLYTSHAATALLDTLETGGSCARLVPGNTATVEQRRAFDAFCTKLGEGGLFVVMASSEILACCSSTNENYTEKLALASALCGLSGTVVVSHVKVADYTAFADAAAQAETVRW